MLITYGIGILIFTVTTFICIFLKIMSYVDTSNDEPDVMKGIMSYVGDIGLNNFFIIQTIIRFLPYVTSGAFLLILIGMWYGT